MASPRPRDVILRYGVADSFGYPLHRVVSKTEWTNPHGVLFTDYTAACGHTETRSGNQSWRGGIRSARTGELCERGCWA